MTQLLDVLYRLAVCLLRRRLHWPLRRLREVYGVRHLAFDEDARRRCGD